MTRIERLRTKRGWTRTKLAAEAGLTETSIREYEVHGDHQARRTTQAKIAAALGVEPLYLFREGLAR
jgi:transcriptional regulator with XRE-family HTH domain